MEPKPRTKRSARANNTMQQQSAGKNSRGTSSSSQQAESTKQKNRVVMGRGQLRSGDPGLGLPPPFKLPAVPQKKATKIARSWPKKQVPQQHKPAAKAVCSHQERPAAAGWLS